MSCDSQGELSVQYHQQKKSNFSFPRKPCLRGDHHTRGAGSISMLLRDQKFEGAHVASSQTPTLKSPNKSIVTEEYPSSLMTHLNKRPPRVSYPGSSASAVLHWTDSILKKYSEYYGMSSCILACSHSCDDQNWLWTLGDRTNGLWLRATLLVWGVTMALAPSYVCNSQF